MRESSIFSLKMLHFALHVNFNLKLSRIVFGPCIEETGSLQITQFREAILFCCEEQAGENKGCS